MTTPSPNPIPTGGSTGNIAGINITPEQIQAQMAAEGVGASVSAGDRKVPSASIRDATGAVWGYQSNSLFGAVPPGTKVTATESGVTYPGDERTVTGARSVDDVKSDIYRMSDDQREALGRRLVASGALEEGYTRLDLEAAWKSLVELAADYHDARPDTDLTPDDMISLYGDEGGGFGANKAGVRTMVERGVDLTSAVDARALLERVLYEHLGRRPTGKEADDFQSSLNDAQRKNPVVSSTTTTTNAKGEVTDRSGTSSGGFQPGNYADRYARTGENEEEFKHYQAATTYTNALMDAIKGPMG